MVGNRHSLGLIRTRELLIFVQKSSLKSVTIVVPNGNPHLTSITGSYEILHRANAWWQKMGNRPVMEIRIAGFESEMISESCFFSVRPVNIREEKKNRPADYSFPVTRI